MSQAIPFFIKSPTINSLPVTSCALVVGDLIKRSNYEN